MPRRSLAGARCLVTGASRGIGKAIVDQLTSAGAHVLATARGADDLTRLASDCSGRSGRCEILAGDIASPEFRAGLIDACVERLGGIDVLINNAGIGANGPFADADDARARAVFEVNFFAAIDLTRRAIREFDRARSPAIVNIGSVLGHRAVPGKSEYCASKFALHGFSDSLRAELAADGIDVVMISPSATRTEFFARSMGDPEGAPKYAFAMTSEAVARRTLRALARGDHDTILSWGGWALVWMDRLAPTLTDWLIARFAARKSD